MLPEMHMWEVTMSGNDKGSTTDQDVAQIALSDLEQASDSELVLYQTKDGRTKIQCRFEGESIWLTQRLMAELFSVSVPTINEHIAGIYGDGELTEPATVRKFRIVRTEGNRTVSREVEHYNLAMIVAIGFRVRNQRGVQFRQWANERLSEYMLKGFTMDDERLKNPPVPGSGLPDYFDEQLERIREIRASEKRVYLRVRDILQLAADYKPSEAATKEMFVIVQNKLHFAATGKTAPELIAERANAAAPNMGLTTWKGDVIRKGDTTVAKNYLSETEIDELNRIVVMFLDFAEDQARRRKQVFVADWQTKLDEFLRFNDRNVLPNAGSVSREQADAIAASEYAQFEQARRDARELAGEADAIAALEEIARATTGDKS
jgi:hypothetical protein